MPSDLAQTIYLFSKTGFIKSCISCFNVLKTKFKRNFQRMIL